MQLSQTDPHHWAPVPQVLEFLESQFGGKRVLDVGPGHSPLPWATTSVDFVNVPGVPNLINCDLSKDRLPFSDNSFDFVYCRHMLEDMFDPFPICEEMSRVGKAGYIETPSPVAEMCRGVDGGAPPYRGYHHHRFVVWSHIGELRFVSKYPLVEHLRFDEGNLVGSLRSGPRYWNTYHLWTDSLMLKHHQSPLDFDIPRDYSILLADAVRQSKTSADVFWRQMVEGDTKSVALAG